MTIKDIYNGDNTPITMKYVNGGRYARLGAEWLKIHDELVQGLTEKQRELFNKLTDIQAQQTTILNESCYTLGFRHGARLMMNILSNEDKDFV